MKETFLLSYGDQGVLLGGLTFHLEYMVHLAASEKDLSKLDEAGVVSRLGESAISFDQIRLPDTAGEPRTGPRGGPGDISQLTGGMEKTAFASYTPEVCRSSLA